MKNYGIDRSTLVCKSVKGLEKTRSPLDFRLGFLNVEVFGSFRR